MTAVKPIKLETNVKSPIKQELRGTEGRIDEQITKVFFEYEILKIILYFLQYCMLVMILKAIKTIIMSPLIVDI